MSWRFGKPDRSYGEFGGILEGSQQGDAAFFEGEPYQAQKDVETVLKRHGPTCNEGKVKEPPFLIKKSSGGKGRSQYTMGQGMKKQIQDDEGKRTEYWARRQKRSIITHMVMENLRLER